MYLDKRQWHIINSESFHSKILWYENWINLIMYENELKGFSFKQNFTVKLKQKISKGWSYLVILDYFSIFSNPFFLEWRFNEISQNLILEKCSYADIKQPPPARSQLR